MGPESRNFNPNYFELELYIQKVYTTLNLFIIRGLSHPSSGHSIELRASGNLQLQDQLL
jgi:hypothetical protein